MSAAITTFQSKYAPAYRDLNLEWIEKYFKVEQKDLDQVNNPSECLSAGGEIFFVVKDNEAVGTCAMYKMSEGIYELAKMAVSPKHHGQGYADLMMIACEDWARSKQAKEIHLLSNTILEPAIALYKKHGYTTVHLGPHPDYERCNIEMRKIL